MLNPLLILSSEFDHSIFLMKTFYNFLSILGRSLISWTMLSPIVIERSKGFIQWTRIGMTFNLRLNPTSWAVFQSKKLIL